MPNVVVLLDGWNGMMSIDEKLDVDDDVVLLSAEEKHTPTASVLRSES